MVFPDIPIKISNELPIIWLDEPKLIIQGVMGEEWRLMLFKLHKVEVDRTRQCLTQDLNSDLESITCFTTIVAYFFPWTIV